ncbi:ribonuclease HII, partial [Candidatus Calescamantes bacterium]|nr:ribonuclease HII [Candidatus Calescamantes bacterium]
PDEIDKVNILNATKNAAVRLVAMLSPSPQVLLLDALKLPIADIEQHSFIMGDLRIYSIGAASIIAKVVRDRLMIILGEKYPQYGFAKHKGYGTKEHLAAINEFGPSAVHRRSFEPMRSMGEDNLFS